MWFIKKSDYNKEIAKWEEKINNVKALFKSESDQLNFILGQVDKAKKEAGNLPKELLEIKEQKRLLFLQFNEIKNKTTELLHLLDDLKKQKEVREGELAELNKKFEDLVSAENAHRDQLLRLSAVLADNEKIVKEEEQKKLKLQAENLALEQQQRTLIETNTRLTSENNAHEEQMKTREGELEVKKQGLLKFQSKLERYYERIRFAYESKGKPFSLDKYGENK